MSNNSNLEDNFLKNISEKKVIIGKNAASVLPDAVEAQSSTFLSVLKIASPAAT